MGGGIGCISKIRNFSLGFVRQDYTMRLFYPVAYRGGVGAFNPPTEIPKALQNRAKLNPICENC